MLHVKNNGRFSIVIWVQFELMKAFCIRENIVFIRNFYWQNFWTITQRDFVSCFEFVSRLCHRDICNLLGQIQYFELISSFLQAYVT